MAISKEQRLANFHQEAMAEFDSIQSALRDERLQCLQDRRFATIAGAQWEGPLQEQFDNRPRFEVNKVHLACMRVENEYRANRITVDFISKDGSESDKLADTCDGLYRADEQDSVAEEAYDNAFQEAVLGGFGAWRLRTKYEDEYDPENDHQRICIEPIYDADSSVFFDLNAKRQNKSDAKKCFVITSMTRGAYEAEYGEIDPSSWTKTIHQYEFDWLTPDVVYIAEVYCVEEPKETLYVYRHLDGTEETFKDEDFEEDEELESRLEAIGARELRKRTIKCRKVRKYIIDGRRVIEDCGYIAGTQIPIVPVYGKRWFVDNVERCMGHVRLAKDAQRLKNMQLSKLGEISALSSVSKPIFTPEQIVRHAPMWEEDNIKNYPFLMVDPITDPTGQAVASGPIAYTKPPEIPPAMAALLQITETDMQDVLGNQQAGEQLRANTSDKAVELVQTAISMQTFIYTSNFSKAMQRCGEIWLPMAKDTYVEDGRRMKTVGSKNEIGSAILRRPVMTDDGPGFENDLSKAKFDVVVDVGPSSTSKRAATVRAILNMMAVTQDPETLQILGAMLMMNLEGEGIEDVRGYFRKKLLKMGAIQPTEQEAQELIEEANNQQPDPQALYLQAAAEQAQADAANSRAQTVYTVARAEKTQAETAKIASEIDMNDQKQALEVIDRITARTPLPPEQI